MFGYSLKIVNSEKYFSDKHKLANIDSLNRKVNDIEYQNQQMRQELREIAEFEFTERWYDSRIHDLNITEDINSVKQSRDELQLRYNILLDYALDLDENIGTKADSKWKALLRLTCKNSGEKV